MSIISTENIWANVSRADSHGQESQAVQKRKYRDVMGDHFGLVEVFDDWYFEKQSSNFKELLNWCMRKHLQNRALMMAKEIKEQLLDIVYKVDTQQLLPAFKEDIKHYV